jgi:tetratricopeptide (TPR) repeat protein
LFLRELAESELARKVSAPASLAIFLICPTTDLEEAHYGLGCAYLAQKQYEPALTVFRDIVRRHPNSVIGYRGVGWIHRTLYKAKAAIEAYKEAVVPKPCYDKPSIQGAPRLS